MKILSKLAQISFISVVSIFLMLSLASPASAAEPTKTLQDFQRAIDDPKYNKESFDFQSLMGLASGTTTFFIGCVIDNDNDGAIDLDACPESLHAGALHYTTFAIAALIQNPPASGMEYLADVGSRLNFVQPAYAQGFGFQANQSFVPFWRTVRNLTYILFVLGAIIFGIMIMLRTKISPQAVITVQSALPKVVIALVFITFSYAIVGFLIDLVYVFFGLMIFGLSPIAASTNYDPQTEFDRFVNSDFGNVTNFILGRGIGGGVDIFRGINIGLPGPLEQALGGLGIVSGIIALLALALSGSGVTVTLGALPFILGIIVTVFVFLLRVLFTLARSYILLLFHLIFAPIIILFSTLANRGIWDGWLRGVMANLLVFPAVGVVIFVTDRLVQLSKPSIWGPPFVGSSEALVNGMISLGAVMLLPSIPDFINQILGTKGLPVQIPEFGRGLQNIIENLQRNVLQRGVGSGRGACLPPSVHIDTPNGSKILSKLMVGSLVWSIDLRGFKIAVPLIKVSRTRVPATHKMLYLLLEGGRELSVSPTHPTADGRTIEQLATGDILDNHRIIKTQLVSYNEQFTYDLLPDTETGFYWANGILLGSTLSHKTQQVGNFL